MTKLKAVVFGFLYALLLTSLAFSFAGGGHGWLSSFWLSLFSLAVIPLVALAVVWRRFVPQLVAVLVAVAFDVGLVLATQREEMKYMERSFSAAPIVVVLWIALWISWQVALVAALFRADFFSRSSS
jgi:hypothetical protein